jgi:predicted O-methyltransferase YrrM
MNSHKKETIEYALSIIYGGMKKNELEFLYDICQNKTVLELGSMVGMSSYVIASVAAKLDCVDTWDESFKHLSHDLLQLSAYNIEWLSKYNQKPNMLEIFKNNCKKYIDCDKIKIIQGKTSDVVSLIDNEKYDIILVDADHSYEGVKQDIAAYINKLKKNGIMLFHDYGGSWWPGVDKAVDESIQSNLLKKYYDHKNSWLIEAIAVCIKNN